MASLFVLIGFLVAVEPEEARAFFARQVRFLYGDERGRRYRDLPSGLFRLLGVVSVVVGLGLCAAAAGGV